MAVEVGMYLLGDTLTKTMATVAALLTVLAGVPYVRCVCPDGRVKLFCSGPSALACCCAPSQFDSAKTASANTHSCCSHSDVPSDDSYPDRDSTPQGGDGSVVGKKCGCERKVVSEAASYSAEEVGAAGRFEAAAVTWETLPVISEDAFFPRRVPTPLLPPPDRVVRFCHFTC
jgi:hypothetical protein